VADDVFRMPLPCLDESGHAAPCPPWFRLLGAGLAALWLVGLHAPLARGSEFDPDLSQRAERSAPARSIGEVNESSWWFRLRGGYAQGGTERRRAVGLVELGIGLDSLVRDAGGSAEASGLARPDADPAEPEEPETAPELALWLSPESLPANPSPGLEPARFEPGHRARSTPTTPVLRLSPRLARAAVLVAFQILERVASPRRLEGMASRARAAASLPEVRLGAGTSRDESLRFAPTVSDPARFTRDGGRDLWFEARLTWQLDRALFARDELAVERLRAQAREDRSRVAREVLDALLDWQRSRQAQASPLATDDEREVANLRELGAVARLDVLTEGWFSRTLEQNGAAAGIRHDADDAVRAAPTRVLSTASPETCGLAGSTLQGPPWLPRFGRCSWTSKGASMR
jgi:hypothetical protein